jgi:hypothetical protein
MLFNFILPVLFFTALFFLFQLSTRKNISNNNIFLRTRILLVSIYLGYLVSEVARGAGVRSVITMVCFAGILLYGVYTLQKKYFIIKNSE